MPDDLNKKKIDRSRINIDQPWEVQYWTEKLQVSEALLRLAVSKAGHDVEEVKSFLERLERRRLNKKN